MWTCGVNDDAALGRVTQDVPDPENPGEFMNIDELTSYPQPLHTLVDEGFRAVKAVAGDSICAAVSDKGELRVWGSFRVYNLHYTVAAFTDPYSRSMKGLSDSLTVSNTNIHLSLSFNSATSPATLKRCLPLRLEATTSLFSPPMEGSTLGALASRLNLAEGY